MDKPAAGVESEHKASDALQKNTDCDHFQSTTDRRRNFQFSKKGHWGRNVEWKISHKIFDMSGERAAESSDNAEGLVDRGRTIDPQKVDQNGVSFF